VEALDLFDEICNIKYFEKTTMILMLNKRDIFEEKVSKVMGNNLNPLPF